LINRAAIRIENEPLRRARRLRISVWQAHFWRKPIVQLPTHSAPKQNPNPRKRNNMIKNIKIFTVGNRLFHCAVCGLGIAVFSWLLPALAVNANINIVNFAFSPNTANIGINDTVTWTWVGSPHTTTSDTGLWDSGVFGTGHTFSRTFTSAGTFPFHCTVHPFMTGSINVQAVNVPPSVALTNPPNGTVFAAPASFTLTAKASDSDGSVTNVEFLQGASVLRNIKSPPYSVSVGNLPAGTYTFSAVATDNSGSKATNTATISVVTPEPISLTAPRWLPPASFKFSYSATAGLSYVVQRSLDLTHWTALSTNTAAGTLVVFTDQNATGNRWFYQVGLLPNP
jgi:plastocyanin